MDSKISRTPIKVSAPRLQAATITILGDDSHDDDDDDDRRGGVLTPPKTNKRKNPTYDPAIKKQEMTGSSPGFSRSRHAHGFTIEAINNVVDGNNQISILGGRDARVTRDLFRTSSTHWKLLLDTFLNGTQALVRTELHKMVQAVCKPWEKTLLWNRVHGTLKSFLKELFDERMDRTIYDLQHELYQTMNFDDEARKAYSQEALADLKKERTRYLARVAKIAD